MRLFFCSTAAIKRAAKQLTSPHKLSERHDLLAKSCGYRDFHDVTKNLVTANEVTSQRSKLSVGDWADLVIRIADETGKEYGETQYQLLIAHFLPIVFLPVEGAISLREKIFERTTLPPAVGRVRGAVVRFKPGGRGKGERAFFLREQKEEGNTLLLADNHIKASKVATNECVIPREPLPSFIPTRLYEPYGYLTEDDGTIIIFSRDYLALWKIVSGGAVERPLPFAVSMSNEAKWFRKPRQNLREDIAAESGALQKFRLIGFPRLVETLPRLIATDGDFRSVIREYVNTMKS